ncbi:retrovirus-related pol polyprotein from transposon TNT 1-94 [Tanacetum coccineum]
MGPPPATPGSEKSVSFQKSILGPRPKHIIVNKVKILVASNNEVKQFYKPLTKPGVGFSKTNFRSKTPPPRRVNNNYSRPKTPQPKRHVGRQNQPYGFPIFLGVDLEPNEWIKDSGCSKDITGNRKLFSTYKAYNGGNVIFGSNLRGNIISKDTICAAFGFSETETREKAERHGKIKDKNDKSFKENQSNVFLKEYEQYFEIQDLKAQLQDKGVIPTTSVSRPQPKSNHLEDRVMSNNSQGKKQEVEYHRRKFKFSNNKTSLVEIVLFHRRHLCSKHMIGNLKLLTNFVEKFPGTVKFGNDHIAPILGYGDLFKERLLSKGGLHAQVTTVRTDKGTEFLNKTLHAYFAKEGIRHETSTARTPKQNGVVERRNRTLVEAARTMLSAAKVPLFFWAEAIATACFTQNCSLVIPRHEKTPYHIINARKPSVKFFHIFGSLCYIVRDGENLDKMKEKGDACIFVGYSTQSKAYRVFNKRTRMIVETIHVNFDELCHHKWRQINVQF